MSASLNICPPNDNEAGAVSSAWDGLENSLLRTELPHYAINANVPEDTFYTNRDIAKRCVNDFFRVCKRHKIKISNYIFIEPSAGEGCFYDFLPDKKIGLDIAPRNKKIRKTNFLTWKPRKNGKYIVIGNPPFGHRGAIALAFIKRALLFSDVVAFILPMSFYSNGKGSNMKRVPEASLIYNQRLPTDAFYLPDTGKPMSVNTVFQIWAKGNRKSVFTDYDISQFAEIYTCCSNPDRYCGLGRGRSYDCFIASTFYNNVGIVDDFKDVLYGSGYGLILKKQKRNIMQLLKKTDWTNYCTEATNQCKHIRMFHLRQLLGENGFGKPSKRKAS